MLLDGQLSAVRNDQLLHTLPALIVLTSALKLHKKLSCAILRIYARIENKFIQMMIVIRVECAF